MECILICPFHFFSVFLSPCASPQLTLGECLPEWMWAWLALYLSRTLRKEALAAKAK